MHRVIIATIGAILVAGAARADDVSVAVIKKAIKAHGGAENLKKAQSVRGTAIATVYKDGVSIIGEIEYVIRLPDHERVTTQTTCDPNKVVRVVTKDQFYFKYGDQAVALSKDEQAEKKTN